MAEETKRRILSGMRPTGKLHLGNYYGALYNWLKLQEEYECYYFVADWHALTTEYDAPQPLGGYIAEMVIDWLAVGLDPQRSTIFVQSAIPEHAELYLIFGMFTPVPWLERVPTYKDQMQELSHKELATYGFLGYPVLQAADILVYKAHGVPVGVDQVPHVEMTREIARRFNHLYKPIFPEPEALLAEVPKLTGTDGRKMSKSYDNCIYLSDPPEVMARKVSRMVTDVGRPYRKDPGEPDRCLAFPFHRLNLPVEKIEEIMTACRSAELGCVECKKLLAEALVANLTPIYEKRRFYEARPDMVREVLLQGNKQAREQARRTMHEVREAIAFHLDFQLWV
ncbi:MAG: tryptophan--tRNA ligase [Deltaproteobacteria bacterium]|nr:tryptophan--tRNA ligase [Deltaproteobacteria bacterium]